MIIEWLLALAVIGGVSFAIFSWLDKGKLKRLQKKYDENDDKSKQGEQRRTGIKGRGINVHGGLSEAAATEPSSAGSVESKGEQLLPTTSTEPDGETSNSSGKSDGITDFFTKLQKK